MLRRVNILGNGEPWTHPKFLDWLDSIDAAGTLIDITTAGDLINDARADRLRALRNLRSVTFSVDSPDPSTYFEIRGQPLKRALDGIRLTLAVANDPSVVRIAAVVMRNNLASLAGFPELLAQFCVKRLVLRGVVNTKHDAGHGAGLHA